MWWNHRCPCDLWRHFECFTLISFAYACSLVHFTLDHAVLRLTRFFWFFVLQKFSLIFHTFTSTRYYCDYCLCSHSLFLRTRAHDWVMPNVFHSVFILLFYIVAPLFSVGSYTQFRFSCVFAHTSISFSSFNYSKRIHTLKS